MADRSSPAALHRPLAAYGSWALLIVLFAVTAAGLYLTGRLTATDAPDTTTYRDFPWNSLAAALSSPRTPGYPLLLRAATQLSGSLNIVPAIQLAMYFGAVLLFAGGLRVAGGTGWQATWIAGSLCGANILTGYVQVLATDTLAAALGIASAGMLLILYGVHRPAAWMWLLLSLLVALAWLVRPAYLALVPFLVLAGMALHIRRERCGGGRGLLFRQFVPLLLAVAIPLVGWCTLRWGVVGRFGIVSFGGMNLAAIAGQFLDDSLVPQLPADLQPLARAALERRASLPPGALVMTDVDVLNYQRMESNYDVTFWQVFVPAAAELYGGDMPRMNAELQNLARAIIALRPRAYGIWLLKASRRALWKLLGDFVENPLGAVLITICTGLLLWIAIHPNRNTPPCRPESDVTQILLIISALYAACQLATTILVCPPLGRMTDAAGVFLPALTTAALLRTWPRRTSAVCR